MTPGETECDMMRVRFPRADFIPGSLLCLHGIRAVISPANGTRTCRASRSAGQRFIVINRRMDRMLLRTTVRTLPVSFCSRLFFCSVALLCLSLFPASGQDDQAGEDSVEISITEPVFAPGPGSFGIFGGPTFALSSLKTTDLDPDLDDVLILKGGYGYVILSHWLIGGGGAGITLEQPNNIYDKFSMGFGGFLTGYDRLLVGKLSGRIAMLVGGGDLSMIKRRPDLSALGENEFLERYREEEFFLLHPEVSVGYAILPFIDVRLAASYWYPIGSADVDDLRQFNYGLHVMIGFRNNILQ